MSKIVTEPKWYQYDSNTGDNIRFYKNLTLSDNGKKSLELSHTITISSWQVIQIGGNF